MPAPTRRWSAPTSATTAQQLLAAAPHLACRGSTTRYAASCASNSARGCSTIPTSTRPRPVDPASFLTPSDRAAARKAAGESMVLLKNDNQTAAARPVEEDRADRPARRRPARHARPVVGPGQGRGRGQSLRRHQGEEIPEPHVHPGLHDEQRRAAAANDPANDCTDTPRLRRCGLPPRPPSRSCSHSARRARWAARPSLAARLDLPGHQQELIDQIAGDRQAVHRRAVQQASADAHARRSVLPGDPRGLVPGYRGGQRRRRRAVRHGRTLAASCRSPSRSGSGRCRSTTTTSRPVGRATPRRSTTRATVT